MTPICDFVEKFPVAGKSFKEIEQIVKNTYADKAIKWTPIHDILEKVKE
jgi:hypothetical protein